MSSTHPEGSGHPAGTWGGNSEAAKHASFAIRHHQNEKAVKYFAAGVCGILAIFILAHILRHVYRRGTRSGGKSLLRTTAYPFVCVSRTVRSVLLRPLPGFTSSGHALTIAAYTAINAAVSFTNVDTGSYGALANRFGWMISGNLCVLVFLALKNTPLGFLVGYSYERINILHQAAGYTTVLFTALHAIMYAVQFMTLNRPEMLRRPSDVSGIVAGFGMLVMFAMPLLLKGSRYEVFYVSHITSFIIIIVTAALHQHKIAEGVAIMTIVAGALWAADRVLRALRLNYNAWGNYAKLYPLSDGGTRVLVRRPPGQAVPGQHCFLWIPGARLFETHPFSIVATEPWVEFVVNSRDGFTRDLRALALQKEGAEVLASLDGPYGTFPDPLHFDRVVIIAGGSGASFAFGVLGSLLSRMGHDHPTEVEFTWTARESTHLSWYQDHIDSTRSHEHASKISLTLHITRETADNFAKGKGLEHQASFSDVEKAAPTVSAHESAAMNFGRPNIKALIESSLDRARPEQRVLVVTSGPAGLMRDIRKSVAATIRPNGPGVELHCEQFGW